MSPEQRALINKKRCDQYAAKKSSKKAAKELQFSPDTTVVNNTLEAEGTNDYVHPESTSIVKEQEQLLGDGNEDSRTENSRKELRLQRDRARRAAMSPEKIALINKRRRDEYAAKNAPKKAAKQQMMLQKNSEITGQDKKELKNKRRREQYAEKHGPKPLPMTPESKKVKRKESKKSYNRRAREHRSNNLHPDSIAIPSPHFTPQLIFSSTPTKQTPISHQMEIPEFGGSPIPYFDSSTAQNPDIEIPELSAARFIHRHRVTHGERNSLISRRNRAFEANIGGRTREL
ncbi:unnamed protein product, partial [Urochloa humidicola]